MSVTAVTSNHYKYALATGEINLLSDTIKILLMRDGFSFNKDNHKTYNNLKGTISGNNNIDFSASNSTITKSDGGFLNAGFIERNQITITGTTNNNITGIIGSVTDTVITLSSGTLTDETGTSAVITADDELPTGNGYTQNAKTTGTVTLTEDDTNDRLDATFPTITWTASGGNIGATSGAILYDETSTDKVIIGYIDFGTSQTATDGTTFNISAGCIRIL